MKPRVFIAYAVQETLQADAEGTMWDQDVIQPSQLAIEGLLRAVEHTDFAIRVFAPDNLVTIRDARQNTPRDNVIFECGLCKPEVLFR